MSLQTNYSVYLDQDFPKLCPVRTLLYYQSKKTPRQLEKNFAFLLSVKQTAEKDPLKEVCWYTDHPMGVNYIGALFKNAVSKAGIDIGDKKVTATTARKNLAQSGAEGGVPSTFLSKMLAQKNMDSKLEYLTNTEETHKAASLVVNRGVHGESGTDFSAVFNDVKAGPEPEVKDKVVSDTKPTNFEASRFSIHPIILTIHLQTTTKHLLLQCGISHLLHILTNILSISPIMDPLLLPSMVQFVSPSMEDMDISRIKFILSHKMTMEQIIFRLLIIHGSKTTLMLVLKMEVIAHARERLEISLMLGQKWPWPKVVILFISRS